MNGGTSTPASAATSNLKRPRQSAGMAAPGVAGPSATSSRVKRRKNELDDGAGESSEAGGRGRGGSSMAVGGKGKEEDGGESGEIQTKIDFKTLPVETLYKYLEHHDLLPKWEVSPWSEDLQVAPRDLYNAASTTAVPATVEDPLKTPPTVPPTVPEVARPLEASQPETNGTDAAANSGEATTSDANAKVEGAAESTNEEGQETPIAPTTRSKTAPHRKEPTPPRDNSPKADALITLSDIHAAKEVLAERANAHWAKGLGGGQNKEGETIVNFLYKLKVEPGRLLRIYNPTPTTY